MLKRVLRYSAMVIVCILLLPLILILLLSFHGVQNYLVQKLTPPASQYLETTIELGGFSLSGLRYLKLTDFLVEDQKGDTLCYIPETKVRLSLKPLLFDHTIQLNDLQFLSPKINLSQNQDSVYNFQFIVDKLSQKDSTSSSNWKFVLQHIGFEKGRISFASALPSQSTLAFNPKHFTLSELNASLILDQINSQGVKATLQSLSLKEEQGFSLENLQLSMLLTDSSLVVPSLSITLPHSQLVMKENRAEFKSLASLISSSSNFDFTIDTLYLSPQDLAFLWPKEHPSFHHTAQMKGHFYGSFDNIHIDSLKLRYGEILQYRGQFQAIGLSDIHSAYLYNAIDLLSFDAESLEDLLSSLRPSPVHLPKEAKALGLCEYKGNITGFLTNAVLFGKLSTNIGQITTDMGVKTDLKTWSKAHYHGTIKSDNLQIQNILPKLGLGNVGFEFNADLSSRGLEQFLAKGKLNFKHFTYKNYTYHNLKIVGQLDQQSFLGEADFQDKNGAVHFKGNINLSDTLNKFNFVASIDSLRPQAMNWTKTLSDVAFSTRIRSSFQGDDWDKLNGYIHLDSTRIANDTSSYGLDSLHILAYNDHYSTWTINSDLLEARITGYYQVSSFISSVKQMVAQQVPTLFESSQPTPKTPQAASKLYPNIFNAYLKLKSTEELADILGLPVSSNQSTEAQIYYNDSTKRIRLQLSSPEFYLKNRRINHLDFKAEYQDGLELKLRGTLPTKTDSIQSNIVLNLNNSTLTTNVLWSNQEDSIQNKGELYMRSIFNNDSSRQLSCKTEIWPTEIIMHDSLFRFDYSQFSTDFHTIAIQHFGLETASQRLELKGLLSKNISDTLEVTLQNISLDYISSLLPSTKSMYFSGQVSGHATITQSLKLPLVEAKIDCPNFAFNKVRLGNIKISSVLNHNTESLDFKAFIDNDTLVQKQTVRDHIGELVGQFFYTRDSLYLGLDAHGINLALVNYYTSSIFDKVKGKGYGHLDIGVKTSHPSHVNLYGDIYAKEATLGVDFLKSDFNFSDTIFLRPHAIYFDTIQITDPDGNRGQIWGRLSHHDFHDMILDINGGIDHMMVLNTTIESSPKFYGKVYATGSFSIKGDSERILISANAKAEDGSQLFIPIDSYYAEKESYINFASYDEQSKHGLERQATDTEEETKPSTILDVNAFLDINSGTKTSILIDRATGDKLQSWGHGALRLTYSSGQDVQLYGNYTVDKGDFHFTFQNTIYRVFTLSPGSTVNWTGDLMGAKLDCQAYYRVSASLKNIISSDIVLNRSTVPVKCAINVTGQLTKPTILYDISLPNSDEEIQRALQIIINTQEEKTRQLVSLLVLGSFISPEVYSAQQSLIQQNNVLSMLSATISSQLNAWASQMFEDWEFGVNFVSDGTGDDTNNQYELSFLYSPNQRISINGTVGYHDNNIQQSSKMIGDFDLEYKLTKNGRFSAKAYSHTNDYKEFKRGDNTQGIGLIYRETFNNLADLWMQWTKKDKKTKEQ